ncbi:peptidase domain-containing ABC transporter [Glaciecola sp. MF2-115]|uniref:peptidase domain-containing ABC transporter n=1 Tax=Glaciecola sp. MF2-115 TaxID=3384827 RepID=UPI00399F78ED
MLFKTNNKHTNEEDARNPDSRRSVANKLNKVLNFSSKTRLNVVMQAEASECGLACIVMIANYYGNYISLDKLRQRNPISNQGSNLNQIMQIGDLLGMSSRALKVELSELNQLNTPCILHWNFQHFVVLTKVSKSHCTIADPALGTRNLTRQQVSEAFTGVAIEMQPNKKFKQADASQKLELKHFLTKSIGLKRQLTILFSLSLLLQLFAIASPFYMQTVIDEVLIKSDISLLTVLAIAFALLLLIDTLTSLLRERVMLYFSNQFSIHMSTRVFTHLLSLPLNYFQKRHLGDIVSRFGSLQNIRKIVTSGIISGLIDGLMAVIMLLVLFIYSAKLAIVVCLVVLLYTLLRGLSFSTMKQLNMEVIHSQANENTHFMQSVRAIKTIKLNNNSAQRGSQWLNLLGRAMNNQIKLSTWEINIFTLNKLLFGLENILIVYLAANLVTLNLFSIGMLYAFMSYKNKFINATDGLINNFIEFKMLRVHLDRLADIVFTESELNLSLESEINNSIEKLSPKLESVYHLSVRDLSFKYHNEHDFLFKNLNFNIAKGKSVAIVGASGCGKSSLLLCLMGLNISAQGKVYINGHLLNARNRHHHSIAAVLQDDQLLSGTVLENITDFAEQSKLSLAIEASKTACLHDDIMSMTMQYNTLIGDMGNSLSGGQKQRLLLARALYKEPSLLFLDEATSHLDAANESIINENLKHLSMTKIMIAHRQETIVSADIVLAFIQGELCDVSHQYLAKSTQQQHQNKEYNDEYDNSNTNAV